MCGLGGRPVLWLTLSMAFLVSSALAEDTDNKDTVLRDRIRPYPLSYQEKPPGFSETPNGYEELPAGFSPKPSGFVETPSGFRETPMGALKEPYGYSPTPPRFIEKDYHPQANKEAAFLINPSDHPANNSDPSFRITLDDHPSVKKGNTKELQ